MRSKTISISQHLQHLPGKLMPPHLPSLLLPYIYAANILET